MTTSSTGTYKRPPGIRLKTLIERSRALRPGLRLQRTHDIAVESVGDAEADVDRRLLIENLAKDSELAGVAETCSASRSGVESPSRR